MARKKKVEEQPVVEQVVEPVIETALDLRTFAATHKDCAVKVTKELKDLYDNGGNIFQPNFNLALAKILINNNHIELVVAE